MSFRVLTEKWCALSLEAKVILVTDSEMLTLAAKILSDIANECSIINFEETEFSVDALSPLTDSDLVIALFSLDTFVKKGANKIFSPFRKPKGLKAKYVFVRLGISGESFLQGLETPKELVYEKINELQSYQTGSALRVVNSAGTDITLQINEFTTCSHEISADGGMAFLPPSESSADVIPNTANGRIVIDVTVGQLYYYGKLLGYFGLVDESVTLIVKKGLVTDITGGAMAAELKEKLFALPENCRILVELGHGLSKMTPTGLVGVDESIIDTCHFGIGDYSLCGVHLDVVVSNPTITGV